MAAVKEVSAKKVKKPFNRTEHDGKKSGGTLKIKWVVSSISCTDDMRETVRGLGLRRLHHVVPILHSLQQLIGCVGQW